MFITWGTFFSFRTNLGFPLTGIKWRKKGQTHCYCHVITVFDTAFNRVFSHDVTAAILVSQTNKTAAMLVSQTSPLGVELFSYANAFVCYNKFAYMLSTWEKTLYSLVLSPFKNYLLSTETKKFQTHLFIELSTLSVNNNRRINKILDPVWSSFHVECQVPVHPSSRPVREILQS